MKKIAKQSIVKIREQNSNTRYWLMLTSMELRWCKGSLENVMSSIEKSINLEEAEKLRKARDQTYKLFEQLQEARASLDALRECFPEG